MAVRRTSPRDPILVRHAGFGWEKTVRRDRLPSLGSQWKRVSARSGQRKSDEKE